MNRALHIHRILIPYDFSETAALALEHATFLAKLTKAELHLVYVIEAHSFVETNASAKFKEMAEKIHQASGITVEQHIEKGKIYKTINNTAEKLKADLIIMGTHGASGFQEELMGSNAYKVVSSAPCPVISVQTHSNKIGFHSIILPIDNSHSSRQKVVPAIEIAKLYKSAIHVVGLIHKSNEETMRKFEVKIAGVKSFVIQHDVTCTSKILSGEKLSAMLMEEAIQLNADLLVIMTDQEGGGIFMGSGAQDVVNHSRIPVMSVRPQEGDPEKISLGY
jgi:nucleotide-binding universal stress UspA family protein